MCITIVIIMMIKQEFVFEMRSGMNVIIALILIHKTGAKINAENDVLAKESLNWIS